jgi:hypothetical protein
VAFLFSKQIDDVMNTTTGYRNFWSRTATRLEQRPIRHLTILYICCFIVFLLAIPIPRTDGQLTGSDGAFYYAFLPTLLLDRDLDFSNQYEKLVPARPAHRFHHSEDGRLINKFPIGPAILWMPFFMAGHLLAILLNAAGFSLALDGMGYVYQAPTLLGSMTYGFAGVLLVYRSCRRFFDKLSSATAAILIWLATNLIYYMLAEPSMAHACSFFAVALFLELWLRFRPAPTLSQWVFLGLAGGLVAIVRLPDATWLALPFIDAVLALRSAGSGGVGRQLKGFLFFTLSAAFIFAPQLVIWQILKATAARTMHAYSHGFFYWMTPEILNVLFSLRHGFYTWHPVLLLATAGLVPLYCKDRILSFLLGLMFAVQLYLISAYYGWFGGNAFGGRMLISTLPALALGLAALVDWAVRRRAWFAVCTLACCLISWNALFFAQYRFGYIPKSREITLHQMTVGKFLMLKDMASRIQAMIR